jgi:hypothetical protein
VLWRGMLSPKTSWHESEYSYEQENNS